jgi:ribosomal protein S1
MAELLAKYKQKIVSFSAGQKVTGKVIEINPKSLILDIGGKSEGTVAEKAFVEARDFIKTLKVGDEITAVVLIPETRDGVTLLSLRQVAYDSSWEKLEKAAKDKTPVAVVGRAVNPSGITVDVDGLLGFIPSSQLGKETSKNPQGLVERHFKAIPIEIDKAGNKVILSEKEVSDAGDIKELKEAFGQIKEGDVFDGEVTTVASFGCFVRVEVGPKKVPVEGLVHISELSWSKVGETSDVVTEGDRVKVIVLGMKDGRLSLSIRRAQKDPWEDVEKKYQIEKKVTGKVVRTSDFGVFVEVEPGIEGLIHITSIPPGKKLSTGEDVNCYVQAMDAKAKKLSLGLVLTSKPIGYK